MINEIIPELRSKYQKKIYEIIEYHHDDFECGFCKEYFLVDLSRAKEFKEFDDQARSFAKVYCPYCGNISYVCL